MLLFARSANDWSIAAKPDEKLSSVMEGVKEDIIMSAAGPLR
jgi:hypothetical protein